ncbi:hypothetical protein [Kitasatospora camelliae]|uniref:Uncharacterized protein n=1 Tax=Kitasatospora camelliae TaxID=3156397 RepID=A0AAU8JX59_9ACTN
MATNQKFMAGFQINRGMLTAGAVLTGLGAAMAFAGTVVLSVAVASAGRGWMQQLDTPPTEIARRGLNQARAASLAGLEAWRTEGRASAN